MSIILYHSNTPIPQHLRDCVTKIKQYSNIPIYLLTDSNDGIDGVETCNINQYSDFNWLNGLEYFNGYDLPQMWKTSCYRLFYIKKLMEEKNLSQVLHFDNDVLLYESPETIIQKISEKYDNFAITAHTNNEVVFGMSYIRNADSIKPLIDYLQNQLTINFSTLKNKYDGFPNEMRLISAYQGWQPLPILPSGLTEYRYTNNYEHFNSVFDPSSYGQHIGGTWAEKRPGWFGTHQEIGKFIGNGKIKVIFENRNPYLIYEGNRIKINNLHIHSKNTGSFL